MKCEARANQRQTGQPVADRAVDRGPVKRTQGTVPRTQSNQSTVQRPSKAAQRPRRSIQSTGSSSVDNLLREVDNIETDVRSLDVRRGNAPREMLQRQRLRLRGWSSRESRMPAKRQESLRFSRSLSAASR